MKYTIIGASAAGIQAAEELRKLDKESEITVISKEEDYPYSRCLISRFIDGRLPQEKLYFKTSHFFKDLNINSALNTEAESIDVKRKKVITRQKKEHSYDRLLIATGSSPHKANLKGIGLKGVHTFHSLSDAREIIKDIKEVKKAVVAGAGFIGLEAAYALTRRGAEVTVVEKMSQLLPKQTDAVASKIIQDDLEGLGVKFIYNQSLSEIEGTDRVRSVSLMDKSRIDCDIVVIATGVRPNMEIAEKTGLKLEKGIITDDYLRTSADDIFAAGDVIEIADITTGKRELSATWFNAVLQGKFAAYNMAGINRRFSGAVGMQNAVQFHQVPMISFGKVFLEPEDEVQNYEVMSIQRGGIYKKLILNNNKISGMIFVGDILKSGFYAALIRNSIDISGFKEKLLDDDFSYAYFKNDNFEQYNPYFKTPVCWDNKDWWVHRLSCQVK